MLKNRSVPAASVIPVLAYPNVDAATQWLCETFGFTVRVRIGSHRIHLNVASGAVILRELRPGETAAALGAGHSLMVRVEDVDAHCQLTRDHGAYIREEPTTYPYGERQYEARDLAGRSWKFSQSVADVDPAEWGGVAENL